MSSHTLSCKQAGRGFYLLFLFYMVFVLLVNCLHTDLFLLTVLTV